MSRWGEDWLDGLRLYETQGVGPVVYRRLLGRYGSPTEVLKALPTIFAGYGRKVPRIPSRRRAERELDAVRDLGGCTWYMFEGYYPPQLSSCPDAPIFLHVRPGSELCIEEVQALLKQPSVSIVGARRASAVGCLWTQEIATALKKQKYTVISGMAAGIDAAAHTSSLPYHSIGVLAQGLDQIYPRQNQKLYETMYATGCLVSEYLCTTRPKAQHFPSRNRIIAGLSLATLVVEASLRSGARITARLALQYGREVMAVPGHPTDPRYRGNNLLLKDGAYLIQEPEDILSILESQNRLRADRDLPQPPPEPPVDEEALKKIKNRILESLSSAPVDENILARHLDISPRLLSLALVELELVGLAERTSDGRYLRVFMQKE